MNYSVLSRLSTIVAIACATTVRADPPIVPTHSTAPSATHSNVQLASADRSQKAGDPNLPSNAIVKKPAARVTTCRCGDQIADPSDEDSNQPQN
jgi:hypothetical protein